MKIKNKLFFITIRIVFIYTIYSPTFSNAENIEINKNIKISELTKNIENTENSKIPKQTENIKNTEHIKISEQTENIEYAKNIKISEQTKNIENTENIKISEYTKNITDTNNIEISKNTEKIKSENTEVNLKLHSKSCILIELSSGNIAYEKDANSILYPASTTKLLTAIITLEKCNLTDTVTITPQMISNIPAGYTTAYLKVGEVLTIEQLLNVLLIPSANDAGYALAIHISGSIENFSVLMNEKAKSLGCTNSNFTNPCGIHNNNHYSTSKDISLIALTALKNPKITEICSKTNYTLQTNLNNINFETTNTLLKTNSNSYYEYCNGLKTGFTSPAGSCIVATAKKDNMEFMTVVLGAPEPTNTINYRDEDCITLFEYGFSNYDKFIITDNSIADFFKNFLITNSSINNFLRCALALLLVYFFYTIIPKKNTNKYSKITTNPTDEFNFKLTY